MKKIFALLLCVIMIISFSGCTALTAVLDAVYGDNAVKEAEAIVRIAFSDGVIFEKNEEVMHEAVEFKDRSSENSKYSSDIFYNTLSEAEKTVYHAYEYALENGYTNILVDDLLVSDTSTLEKVLKYMALESPLLEQNLRYESGDFNMYYNVGIGGFYLREAEFDGYYIAVKNFGAELYALKLKAIEKAEEIVASLPKGVTEAEKAERLYTHIAESITYYDYEGDISDEPQAYLYDALINGRTHCDGYTNAISLLFNMAGIDCVEKMYTASEDEVGHTWNSFCIDGVWYNCDATAASTIDVENKRLYTNYYLGFEDRLQEYLPDYGSNYAACENGMYIPIDAQIGSADSNAFYKAAKTAFAAHNKRWALIVVDNYNERKVDSQVQLLANHFYKDITYYEYALIEGRTAVLICASDY